MPDICEIGRLLECVEANAHEPLELPGGDDTAVGLQREGVEFGAMRACRRCGLMYWEPVPPPMVLTSTEGDDE